MTLKILASSIKKAAVKNKRENGLAYLDRWVS